LDTKYFLSHRVTFASRPVNVHTIAIQNHGNAPQLHLRVSIDHLGEYLFAEPDFSFGITDTAGIPVTELSGSQGTLRFHIESLPPDSTFVVRVVAIQEDQKVLPRVKIISETTKANLAAGDSAWASACRSVFNTPGMRRAQNSPITEDIWKP
jgi:hypothetical protein